MVNIRAIRYDEVSKFSELGNDDLGKVRLKETVLRMWDEGQSQPELCFVIEEEDQFLGRVAYFQYPSEPLEIRMCLLYLSPDRDVFELGGKLIKESLICLKNKGFNSVEYHLYSKDSEYYNEYKEVFLKMGFEILQQKKNFLYKSERLLNQSNRLKFKSLQEVGEKAFIEAIQDVTEGTLDEVDIKSVEALGAEKAAIDYYNLIKDISCNEAWWKLAYGKDNEFVGLIVPQKFSDKVGAINYIGVTPPKRGNGLVENLLIEGTNILVENNVKKIIADIDANNFPMEKALLKLDYQLDSDILDFKLDMKKYSQILLSE